MPRRSGALLLNPTTTQGWSGFRENGILDPDVRSPQSIAEAVMCSDCA